MGVGDRVKVTIGIARSAMIVVAMIVVAKIVVDIEFGLGIIGVTVGACHCEDICPFLCHDGDNEHTLPFCIQEALFVEVECVLHVGLGLG